MSGDAKGLCGGPGTPWLLLLGVTRWAPCPALGPGPALPAAAAVRARLALMPSALPPRTQPRAAAFPPLPPTPFPRLCPAASSALCLLPSSPAL